MLARPVVIALALLALPVGCKKDGGGADKKTASAASATVDKDGTRHIPIEAGQDGYVPDTIKGKPGEKLTLVFTRTVDGDCLAKVKTPDGKEVALPMNTPTPVAITVPANGKVEFACAMDMFKGVVVADPGA